MWLETGGESAAWSAAEALWPQDKVALVFHQGNRKPRLTSSGVLGEHLGRLDRLHQNQWELRDADEDPGQAWVAEVFRRCPESTCSWDCWRALEDLHNFYRVGIYRQIEHRTVINKTNLRR